MKFPPKGIADAPIFVAHAAAFILFFILLMPATRAQETEMLLIVPFGTIEKVVLDHLKDELAKEYGFKVEITRTQPIPEYAYSAKRDQYHSSKILKELVKLKITEAGRILGIVDGDLYVPELNFVFGEANVMDKVCVISLTRLRQEYYGKPKDEKLFLERTLKEAIHEIGHTYGLGHCEDPKCIMHFSNSLSDTDIKGPEFCPKCKLRR